MISSKFKNLDSIEDFKKHIKEWKTATGSCKFYL